MVFADSSLGRDHRDRHAAFQPRRRDRVLQPPAVVAVRPRLVGPSGRGARGEGRTIRGRRGAAGLGRRAPARRAASATDHREPDREYAAAAVAKGRPPGCSLDPRAPRGRTMCCVVVLSTPTRNRPRAALAARRRQHRLRQRPVRRKGQTGTKRPPIMMGSPASSSRSGSSSPSGTSVGVLTRMRPSGWRTIDAGAGIAAGDCCGSGCSDTAISDDGGSGGRSLARSSKNGIHRPRGCRARLGLARGLRDRAELGGECPNPRLPVSERYGVASRSPIRGSPRRGYVADVEHQPAEGEQKQRERDDRDQCAVLPGRQVPQHPSGGRVGLPDGAGRCGPPARGVAVQTGEAFGIARSRTVGRPVLLDENYEAATAPTPAIAPRRLIRRRVRERVEIGVRLDEQVQRHRAVSRQGWYRRFGHSRGRFGSRGSQIEYRPGAGLVPFRT